MKVENYLSKLVKPSTPTSTSLRNYIISFADKLAPTTNVPLILYYSAPSDAPRHRFANTFDHLETTLSETLSEFYPLAGRYLRKDSLVDCGNQGVRFVLGKANVRLSEVLALGQELKPDLLNDFLPCEIGEADDVDDPMLSVKVTTFECGGLAIGMCFSHRLSDMGTMCTFINNWAARSNGTYELGKFSPNFNANLCFPQRDLPELDLKIPRSSIGVENTLRRFLFTRQTISALRKQVGFEESGPRKPSKVQLVVALLWAAFVRIDRLKNNQFKPSFLIQPVGLRDKLFPQLPTNSFGNFWGLATSELGPEKGENIGFQGLFELLVNSVKKTMRDCAKILTRGEEGYRVVIDPYLDSNRKIANNDVNFYLFTSWCRFSFYEADFGLGKPVWTSTGKLSTQNAVILMDDHDGDGVEAWVHLDEERMVELEQDSDIKAYAI